MCQLGYLYNREPVLQCLKEHLVDGMPLPALVKHVAALKDLTTLQLAPGADADAEDGNAASAGDFRAATHVRFACPLTGACKRARATRVRCCTHRGADCVGASRAHAGLQLNGRCRFVALRPSGVVVSERALKTVPDAVAELLGGPALASQAVLVLNGTPEEVDALRTADAAAKAAKKKKKLGAAGKGAAVALAVEPAAKRKVAAEGAERVTGATDRAKEDACAAAKRYKAGEHVPAGATKEVWASIFTSASVEQRSETFGARALSFRR
jgi:hypothetical protein